LFRPWASPDSDADPPGSTEVRLGDEHDDALLARVRAAVLAAGGQISRPDWGVGGSQEIVTYRVTLPEGSLRLTAETYLGLSLSGPLALVQALERRLNEGAANGSTACTEPVSKWTVQR
jgi:hypothetical protein